MMVRHLLGTRPGGLVVTTMLNPRSRVPPSRRHGARRDRSWRYLVASRKAAA
ncbi:MULTISPECIES: hypothetical protein [unclassified Amycolatopsis]|uniref:hypothetical protein n=1 Tax=unclassified Amycolatopsis TaxID=2618356 RepID=UPI00287BAD45|nr:MULTISPECIES: hypothetical protein [unclassified Amycolatopsis]